MRYLIHTKLKPGREATLLAAIEDGSLGEGSVANGEYQRVMELARLREDGRIAWVEVCYCREPLDEERAYWEPYFDFDEIKDAHARTNCRDLNGTEEWACGRCDCTEKLEAAMEDWGEPFLPALRRAVAENRPIVPSG